MKKHIQTLFIFIVVLIVVSLITIITIFLNRAYYLGFEKGLDYFSPDLSESETILKDRFYIDKNCQVKLVFEVKDSFVAYDKEQFSIFLDNLVIQIWNDTEYIEFDKKDVGPLKRGKLLIYEFAQLEGNGLYNIYINSPYGLNDSYHIGIGIGVGSSRKPLSKNSRSYF